jgi:hypothetical protein
MNGDTQGRVPDSLRPPVRGAFTNPDRGQQTTQHIQAMLFTFVVLRCTPHFLIRITKVKVSKIYRILVVLNAKSPRAFLGFTILAVRKTRKPQVPGSLRFYRFPLRPPLLASENGIKESNTKPEADPYFRPYRPGQPGQLVW